MTKIRLGGMYFLLKMEIPPVPSKGKLWYTKYGVASKQQHLCECKIKSLLSLNRQKKTWYFLAFMVQYLQARQSTWRQSGVAPLLIVFILHQSDRFPASKESGYFFLFIMILMIPRITTAKSSNKDITSSIVISTAPFLKKKEQRRPVSPSPNEFAPIRHSYSKVFVLHLSRKKYRREIILLKKIGQHRANEAAR